MAPNEVHLAPAAAVFEAMLSGWQRQQESRFFKPDGTQLSTCPDLAEGEGVGLDAWVEEGDLEGALADRAGLADELVQPRVGDDAVALGVHGGPVRGSPRLPAAEHAGPHLRSSCWAAPK